MFPFSDFPFGIWNSSFFEIFVFGFIYWDLEFVYWSFPDLRVEVENYLLFCFPMNEFVSTLAASNNNNRSSTY